MFSNTHLLTSQAWRWAAPLCALALAGCGGASDEPQPRASILANTANAPLVRVEPEPPGSHCPSGGNLIMAGLDANADGALQSTEASSTQYVCAGPSGSVTLVATRYEPMGANCSNTGYAVTSGLDANHNNLLDPEEVANTSYACQGTVPTGADAWLTLVRLTPEAPGTNCAYGGQSVRIGRDFDSNGVLGEVELTSSSFICHAQPATLAWQVTSQASIQAQPQVGLITQRDNGPVVVTLPPNSALALGDQIRVTGAGSGGWAIESQSNQRIHLGGLPQPTATDWTARGEPRDWVGLAASSDARTLLASDFGGGNGGLLYRSVDSGMTWTALSAGSRVRHAVAMSGDGRMMMAGEQSGPLYLSTDGGATWNAVAGSPTGIWTSIAISGDGAHVLAADRATGSNGTLYLSDDAGVTWRALTGAGAYPWVQATVSDDGRRLAAIESDFIMGGRIRTSEDGGTTWIARESVRPWSALAASQSGTMLMAAHNGRGTPSGYGYTFTSYDGGVTWSPNTGDGVWSAVALSPDGQTRMRATAPLSGPGQLQVSTNRELSWTVKSDVRAWTSVAMNEQGDFFVAAAQGSPIYTRGLIRWSASGPGHGLVGQAFDAVTLEYLGEGAFGIVSKTAQVSFR